MQRTKLYLFILLSLIYFTPFMSVLKVVESDALLFWGLCSWGLISYVLMSFALVYYEKKLKQSWTQSKSIRRSSLSASDKKQDAHSQKQAFHALTQSHEQLQLKERKLLQIIDQMKQKETDYTRLHSDVQHQLDKKETILSEYRSTLQEQRQVIEKKQQDIQLLQRRMNDLKYELENVLKIQGGSQEQEFSQHDLFKPQSVEPDENFGLSDSIQDKLDRYVKMAIKLNSSHHLTRRDGKFVPISLGNLVIDQRRLFDRLQNEENETLLVYSREENRIVFINDRIRELLGWTPERFLQDFSFLVQKGRVQWSEALDEVKQTDQKSIRLLMKAKSGKEVLTHCYLKQVPEGVFKGYVIGILSSAASAH